MKPSATSHVLSPLLAATILVSCTCDTTGTQPTPYRSDVICGPRCVRFILEYYGLSGQPHCTLFDLIREMQWPAVDDGCSLDDISSALRSRHISNTPKRIPPHHPIRGSAPVVVHLQQPHMDIGHFAIWLPSSSATTVNLWSYPDGVYSMPAAQFATARHDVVLYTVDGSEEPVSDTWPSPVTWALCTGAVLLAVAFGPSRAQLSRLRPFRLTANHHDQSD